MVVRLGLEVLLERRLDCIAGRRVGLVTNATGVDRHLISTVQRLHEHPDVNLAALFGPEHGLRGEAPDAAYVETYTDALTGLPVHSLYGATYKPTPDALEGLDMLVFDMQDAGVRFYTYLSTLAYVMQTAAEAGIPVVVLDRPAPINGVTVEGAVLDPAYSSFVGMYPIPIRYGMTIGELATLFNEAFEIGCDLTVIALEGWRRDMWYGDTGLPFVPPSPNIPTPDTLAVYPGLCLIEGTNLSEGRGTAHPFEYIGAPWVKAEPLAAELDVMGLPGVRFRPVYFIPTTSKHQGERCAGVHLYVTDRDSFKPVECVLHMMAHLKATYPEFAWRGAWTPDGRYSLDVLTGGEAVRAHLSAGAPVEDLVSSWSAELAEFMDLRARYLIYPA
jgi:uncharacterized protein YbbC (DUF1343 family)